MSTPASLAPFHKQAPRGWKLTAAFGCVVAVFAAALAFGGQWRQLSPYAVLPCGGFAPAEPNLAAGGMSQLFGQILSSNKDTQIERHGDATVTAKLPPEMTYAPAGAGIPGVGVLGGQHRFFGPLAPGQVAGTAGAHTCIGVIVVAPDGTVFVAHFTAGDTPKKTMRYSFPKGSKAIVFGGDNSGPSNSTLASAIAGLKGKGVTIVGISDTDSCWVDATGKFYVSTERSKNVPPLPSRVRFGLSASLLA
jgi:hypothetical protein